MGTIRAAIAGPGVIARYHADALRRHGVDIAAVVGSPRAADQARSLGVDQAFQDVGEMLRSVDVDVVHVCAPNTLHAAFARAALEAGKHVVCEKPLAVNSRDSAALVALAEQTGLVNACCLNNRMYPLVQEFADRVRAGAVGRVFAVRASIVDDTLVTRNDDGWRLDPALGGDQVVLSTLGPHILDLVSHILDDPIEAVCADVSTCHPRRLRARNGRTEEFAFRGEEIAHVLLRFRSGVRGVIALSHVSAGHPYRVAVEVDAEQHGIAWDSERPDVLWVGGRDTPTQLVLRDPRLLGARASAYTQSFGAFREGFGDTFLQLVRHVYADVDAHRRGQRTDASPSYPTFRDGHRAVLVHEAIVESAATGRWVGIARERHPEL
ncbi:MAG: Gfo/Idh/MocA family oxidoreductase [Chloroflexi bacterium]|nr:Gfo/Idh/MocA family oxidoreductase [Chloroflexota bacterium]